MDLLEDIKRLQGLEVKRKRNLLPRAVLAAAAIALVAAMIMRVQYKYDRAEPNEALLFKPAVLVKKLSNSSGPAPVAVPAAADAPKSAAPRAEALAEAKTAPSPEGLGGEEAFRPGPPEQPDLEKAIDLLMQRRSPKY